MQLCKSFLHPKTMLLLHTRFILKSVFLTLLDIAHALGLIACGLLKSKVRFSVDLYEKQREASGVGYFRSIRRGAFV
jgi:hypothetical protein